MRQAPLVPEVIVGEACPVECAVGTGGQANGEHGHWRASPHLQGQTGMQALVGRLGSTLAKGEGHRGWEVGTRSLYAALEQSETRSWYGEKAGNHHHTPLQALMIPHSGRNTGVAMGVAASSTSAPLSSCPHIRLCVLKVRGGSGRDLGSFPGEPHS